MFSGHVYLGSPGVGGSADAMTFKYKLSRRLALLKDRWVLLAVTTHAVALAVGACARPVTGPQAPNSPVVRIVTLPDSVTLNPSDMRQFVAYGRTQAGDSVPVAVRWSASGGTITGGGLYTADTVAGNYTVTAQATDTWSRVSTSPAVTVTADLTPPAVALSAPTAGAVVSGTVQIAAAASDAGGVASVDFFDGATFIGSTTASPYVISWNAAAVAFGSHTLTARGPAVGLWTVLDKYGHVGAGLCVAVVGFGLGYSGLVRGD